MKKTYFVCAQVLTSKKETESGCKIVNTKATLDTKDLVKGTKGETAEKLKEAIPYCSAILNFWEYSYN